MLPPPLRSTLFPYTTLFRSAGPEECHIPEEPSRRGSGHTGPLRQKTRARPWKSLKYLDQPSKTSTADRKSTRLNSSHLGISYAVFCLKKKKDTKAQNNMK